MKDNLARLIAVVKRELQESPGKTGSQNRLRIAQRK